MNSAPLTHCYDCCRETVFVGLKECTVYTFEDHPPHAGLFLI